MDENFKDFDETMSGINELISNRDITAKHDLIFAITTHIKHSIERAYYHSKESTKKRSEKVRFIQKQDFFRTRS